MGRKSNNHTYYLIPEDDKGRKLFKIDNIKLKLKEVKNGVKITWQAEDTEFEIWFPKERNLISVPWYCQWRRIRSRNMRITRTIRGDTEGVYEYSIYCSKTENLAEGNSAPRMIVMK